MKRCDTCAKLRKYTRGNAAITSCQVLLKPIGRKADCFAWTGDINWENKAAQALENYIQEAGQ